jgi:plasmid stabilization system protein ParE
MVSDYQFSEQTALEYDSIIRYLAIQLQSPQVARNFRDELDRMASLACAGPESFPLSQHQHLAKLGYRKLLINNYVALYTYANGVVTIAHIFHSRQDYAKLV